MASEKDLCQTVTQSLRENGFLNKMSAEVRKEILDVLKNEQQSHQSSPALSTENFIINELIKEYLEWNNLNQTSDVLSLESGQPKQRVSRAELENTINMFILLNIFSSVYPLPSRSRGFDGTHLVNDDLLLKRRTFVSS